jgi:hypothetical protein
MRFPLGVETLWVLRLLELARCNTGPALRVVRVFGLVNDVVRLNDHCSVAERVKW